MKQFARFVSVAAAFAAAVFLAQPAQAQVENVSLGYQYQHLSCSGCTGENLAGGFYVDTTGKIGSLANLNWAGDVDFSHGSVGGVGDNVTSFLGGVRYPFSTSNMNSKPYAQFLVGGTHESAGGFSETDFAIDLGAGLDWMMNPKYGLRVGADYRRVFASGEGVNLLRLIVGITIPVH